MDWILLKGSIWLWYINSKILLVTPRHILIGLVRSKFAIIRKCQFVFVYFCFFFDMHQHQQLKTAIKYLRINRHENRSYKPIKVFPIRFKWYSQFTKTENVYASGVWCNMDVNQHDFLWDVVLILWTCPLISRNMFHIIGLIRKHRVWKSCFA